MVRMKCVHICCAAHLPRVAEHPLQLERRHVGAGVPAGRRTAGLQAGSCLVDGHQIGDHALTTQPVLAESSCNTQAHGASLYACDSGCESVHCRCHAFAHWRGEPTSSMRLPALGHDSRRAWIALAAGTAACDRYSRISYGSAAKPHRHGVRAGTHPAEAIEVPCARGQDGSQHAFPRENR